jgi:hypothetical protein
VLRWHRDIVRRRRAQNARHRKSGRPRTRLCAQTLTGSLRSVSEGGAVVFD